MGLLEIIFTVLILLFPIGEIVRIDILSGAVATVNDLFVGIVVVIWLIRHLEKSGKFKRSNLGTAIFIFAGIGFLSLLFNSVSLNGQQFLVSILYLLRWIFYALIYFVVLELRGTFRKKIPSLLTSAGLIILIGGFVQYFLYPNLRNLYYLGWDEHLYRLFSSFLDPNFAGAFFVLYFLFVAGLFFSLKEGKRVRIVVLAILGIADIIAIYLTYSRSAFMMLIIGVLTLLILRKKALVGFALIIIFVVAAFFTPKAFKTEGTNLFRVVSSEARIESAQKAITIFKENPILGVGFNSYRYAQIKYGFLGKNGEISHAGGGTDNSFLFVLATTGVIGLLAYLFLWGKILVTSLKKAKKGNINSQILFSSSIAILFDSLFINSLFYIFFMMWMWILVGLTENK